MSLNDLAFQRLREIREAEHGAEQARNAGVPPDSEYYRGSGTPSEVDTGAVSAAPAEALERVRQALAGGRRRTGQELREVTGLGSDLYATLGPMYERGEVLTDVSGEYWLAPVAQREAPLLRFPGVSPAWIAWARQFRRDLARLVAAGMDQEQAEDVLERRSPPPPVSDEEAVVDELYGPELGE